MTKLVKYVKVNKSVYETIDQERVRKVYRERLEWFPSGRKNCLLVWDETLNRVRWVKEEICTIVEIKEEKVA